jgi:peptidoglycan/LPS O-acetylase OafA/YrhL
LSKRQYSFDALKILTTLVIIFHHYQQITGVRFSGINFFDGKFNFGFVVELFFIISGYFTYGYIEKINSGLSFPSFFLKKFLRFFPLVMIGAVIFEVLIVVYQYLYNDFKFGVVTVWGTIIASLNIQEGGALPNYGVNNPTWYISVLLLCYVIFYMSIFISKRLKISEIYLHIIMVLLGLGIQTYNLFLPFMNFQASRGYCAFFFGLILARILKNNEVSWKITIISALIVVIIPLLINKQTAEMSDGINHIMTFIYYPALIIVFDSKLFRKIFQWNWIGKLGEISFDTFIWHFPIIIMMYIFMKIFNLNLDLSRVTVMIAITIICFLFGTLSHYLLEKPINKMINNRLEKMNS